MNKLPELSTVNNDLKPDLICICETWTREDILNVQLKLENYSIVCRKDRKDTKKGIGGGILIYAKESICKSVSEVQCDYLEQFNQCAAIKVKFKNEVLHIAIIYRPHNLYNDDDIDENNERLCDVLKLLPKPYVICGDFNYSDIDWKNGQCTKKSRQFYETVLDLFLTEHICTATHKSGTQPDLVLSSHPNLIADVEPTAPLGSSDHTMIKVILDFAVNRRSAVKKGKDWRRADFDSINDMIKNVPWEDEFNNCDIDVSWKKFVNVINTAVDHNVPLRTIHSSRRPPWMTQNVLQSIRSKRRAWKKYSSSKLQQDFHDYKRTEKTSKKMIKKAKKNFENKLAKECKLNPRAFYRYINSKKSNRENIGPLKVNNVIIDNDRDIANELNLFFSSVFTTENTVNVPDLNRIKHDSSDLDDVIFHMLNVEKKILKMKRFSAPGPDNINANLLMNTVNEITYPLTLLFKKSFAEGDVPIEWKTANVTPIFKKGSKSKPENYRPISLTSNICRIMESIIKDAIVKHLSANNLIFPSQHGFVVKRSCLTNLLEYLEDITKLVDDGNCVDVVYLDFAKAFDKCPHVRLGRVLEAHGIVGPVRSWILSWLQGRMQRVVLNGEESDWLPVRSGVPQGSVLGPTLFVLYINTLDIEVGGGSDILSKFADDTKIGGIVNSDDARNVLQQVLNRAVEWSEKWQMQFNPSKCTVIHFGRKNQEFQYNMSGQMLEAVNSEKDLGVHITSDLKPALQCQKAAAKANGVLGRMARSLSYRNKEVWLRLYNIYVRPILEYSVQAWNPWMSKDVKVLEDVQKRAIRMTSGLKGSSYEEKLREVGMQTLSDRRIRGDMIQVWKVLNKYDMVDENKWFRRVDTDRAAATRLSSCPLNLQLDSFNLDIRKFFFSQRVVQKWNDLPTCVKSAETLNGFKNEYDSFYKK